MIKCGRKVWITCAKTVLLKLLYLEHETKECTVDGIVVENNGKLKPITDNYQRNRMVEIFRDKRRRWTTLNLW